MRNAGRRLFDIVDPKIMGVVNACQIDCGAPTRDRLTFVEEHANPHSFEIGDHADGIVIAEHAIDWPLDKRQHRPYARKRSFKRPKCSRAIIAGENTQVIFQAVEDFFHPPHRALIRVGVKVAHVKQG